MHQAIQGFHLDEHDDWVAELACDHFQHVRHNPPWIDREWVTTASGRASKLGQKLNCRKCDSNEPADRVANDY